MVRTTSKKPAKKRSGEHRSNSVKVAALSMLKSEVHTPTEVSAMLKIPTSTLRDWRRAAKKAGTWDMVAAGDNNNVVARPAPRKKDLAGFHLRKVGDALKTKIKKKLDQDPFLSPQGLQQAIPALRKVHKETIRRVIAKELGIPSRLAAAKPFLTESQMLRRLDWAKRHKARSQNWWRKVMWSDETHIELWQGMQQSRRVRRSDTMSRYDPRFIRRTVKHPPKLMIWAAFGNGKLGRLYFVEKNAKMNAEMYKRVLQKHLKPSLNITGCSIFMQDGAPCHTAKSIKAWFADQDVNVLDWVGQSCHLNPIENLWTRLKSLIRKMPACSNLDELTKNIRKAWRKLDGDTAYLTKLTRSMPNRIAAVLEAGGNVTKY